MPARLWPIGYNLRGYRDAFFKMRNGEVARGRKSGRLRSNSKRIGIAHCIVRCAKLRNQGVEIILLGGFVDSLAPAHSALGGLLPAQNSFRLFPDGSSQICRTYGAGCRVSGVRGQGAGGRMRDSGCVIRDA